MHEGGSGRTAVGVRAFSLSAVCRLHPHRGLSTPSFPLTRDEPFLLRVRKYRCELSSGCLFKFHALLSITMSKVASVGVRNDGGYEVVTVDEVDKLLFVEDQPEMEDGFLFPELEHGSLVKLEGKLIRGNEASNSVGLEYQGHVLNCHPEHGNVRQFKSALFLRCVVEGTVSRLTKQRMVAEKRPTIIVSKVVPLEGDDQYHLFR